MAKKNKSILEGDVLDQCYLCGSYSPIIDEHHIFGGSCRKASDKRGLVVHICRDCHRDLHDHGTAMEYLHTKGQMVYEEKIGSRQDFIKEFIKSYL